MSVISDRLERIEALQLESGGHSSLEEGMCIMEAVAYVAGEPFSDHPQCASRLLTSFLIRLNDRLDDDDRQLLNYVDRFREIAPGLRESALQLVDRLIDVSKRDEA